MENRRQCSTFFNTKLGSQVRPSPAPFVSSPRDTIFGIDTTLGHVCDLRFGLLGQDPSGRRDAHRPMADDLSSSVSRRDDFPWLSSISSKGFQCMPERTCLRLFNSERWALSGLRASSKVAGKKALSNARQTGGLISDVAFTSEGTGKGQAVINTSC